jgi:hypothetical protein
MVANKRINPLRKSHGASGVCSRLRGRGEQAFAKPFQSGVAARCIDGLSDRVAEEVVHASRGHECGDDFPEKLRLWARPAWGPAGSPRGQGRSPSREGRLGLRERSRAQVPRSWRTGRDVELGLMLSIAERRSGFTRIEVAVVQSRSRATEAKRSRPERPALPSSAVGDRRACGQPHRWPGFPVNGIAGFARMLSPSGLLPHPP